MGLDGIELNFGSLLLYMRLFHEVFSVKIYIL